MFATSLPLPLWIVIQWQSINSNFVGFVCPFCLEITRTPVRQFHAFRWTFSAQIGFGPLYARCFPSMCHRIKMLSDVTFTATNSRCVCHIVLVSLAFSITHLSHLSTTVSAPPI